MAREAFPVIEQIINDSAEIAAYIGTNLQAISNLTIDCKIDYVDQILFDLQSRFISVSKAAILRRLECDDSSRRRNSIHKLRV